MTLVRAVHLGPHHISMVLRVFSDTEEKIMNEIMTNSSHYLCKDIKNIW